MHLSQNCPFSNKTNLHLELPGWVAKRGNNLGHRIYNEIRQDPPFIRIEVMLISERHWGCPDSFFSPWPKVFPLKKWTARPATYQPSVRNPKESIGQSRPNQRETRLSGVYIIRGGQSTTGGPKWTKMDLFRPKWTKMDYFGPFWSCECECWSSE